MILFYPSSVTGGTYLYLCAAYLLSNLPYFSCRYGERCKFLHVTQQPQTSIFGSGMQTSSQQQQKPNPFGFGVHNTGQSKPAAEIGSKQNQYKVTSHFWEIMIDVWSYNYEDYFFILNVQECLYKELKCLHINKN